MKLEDLDLAEDHETEDEKALGSHAFVCGAAGTGKTFLVKDRCARSGGRAVLCATTGIAAVNLGEGTTINSLLKYFDTADLVDKWEHTKRLEFRMGELRREGIRQIVLDEVSMLDARQLDILTRACDSVGITLCLAGDFAQLAPIKGEFAFLSEEWKQFDSKIQVLTQIRRQADPNFIQALQAARRGDPDAALEATFGNLLFTGIDQGWPGPLIMATNAEVEKYNHERLQALPGDTVTYTARRSGECPGEWKNIPEELVVKPEALVMILANEKDRDTKEYKYVNGDLGTFIEKDGPYAVIESQRKGRVYVHPVLRKHKKKLTEERKKELVESGRTDLLDGEPGEEPRFEILGSITYMPLRLAWASTVHKSQGLSLDSVQVNLTHPFFRSPGMVYVALSRARSAGGLRIVGNAQIFRSRCKANPMLRRWL